AKARSASSKARGALTPCLAMRKPGAGPAPGSPKCPYLGDCPALDITPLLRLRWLRQAGIQLGLIGIFILFVFNNVENPIERLLAYVATASEPSCAINPIVVE